MNYPVLYVDPSGHSRCIDPECKEVEAQHDPNAFFLSYGITFAGNWTPESRATVMSGVRTVDRRLQELVTLVRAEAFGDGALSTRGTVYDPQSPQLGALSSGRLQDGDVFRAVYGQITFRRVSAGTVDGWAWARVATMGEIWVDAVGPQYQQWGGQNTAHELGHAVSQLLGGKPYDALSVARIGYADSRGQDIAVAGGGWGTGYFRTDAGYVLTNGGRMPWQQHHATVASQGIDPCNEDFADMFLNWSYNSFANDPAGAVRNQWMNTNMRHWVALAVTND